MGLLSWLVIGVLVGLIAGKFFAVRGGWLRSGGRLYERLF